MYREQKPAEPFGERTSSHHTEACSALAPGVRQNKCQRFQLAQRAGKTRARKAERDVAIPGTLPPRLPRAGIRATHQNQTADERERGTRWPFRGLCAAQQQSRRASGVSVVSERHPLQFLSQQKSAAVHFEAMHPKLTSSFSALAIRNVRSSMRLRWNCILFVYRICLSYT